MWFDESGLRWKEGTVAWRPGGPARALARPAPYPVHSLRSWGGGGNLGGVL